MLPSKEVNRAIVRPNSFDSSSESPFIHATDDVEEHLKSAVGDADLEQTIHLSGLAPSGALAGSAPVNIPKGGCHQSCQLSPHSPCALGLQANDTRTAGFGIDCSSFSFSNQVNNFT